eukprot:IDg15515t1
MKVTANQDKPDARKIEVPSCDDSKNIKLAVQFFSKTKNMWSGSRDSYYTTEAYVRQFTYVMELFGMSSSKRVKILLFALKENALEEYYSSIKDLSKYSSIRNSSALLKIISQNPETPELLMSNRNRWSSLKLSEF